MRRYPIAQVIHSVCRHLGRDPRTTLAEAGLPAAMLDPKGPGITAAEYRTFHAAFFRIVGPQIKTVDLATAMAQGPFVPALFAFCASPSIEVGLERLAIFKPLVAPCRFDVSWVAEGLQVRYLPLEPDMTALPVASALELVYLIECCRLYSGVHITPRYMATAAPEPDAASVEAYAGIALERAPDTTLVFTAEDAKRPLMSANSTMWQVFEPDLRRQLAQGPGAERTVDRVRRTLLEVLPAGMSSAEAVADRLHLSKRTLQRRLSDEGMTYRAILDATRRDLALNYLARDDIAVPEISFLLAYRDPNSFYRAFQGWTGTSPAVLRRQRRQSQSAGAVVATSG